MQEKLSEVVLILISSTLIILILIILIVAALFISQRRRFRHRQELSELKNVYDREVLKTQLETQAQTFETISRELHDNVGTLISIALVHIKTMAASASEAASKNISEANKTLDEALDILRDISRSLNPDNIQRMGLSQSIRNELERLKRTKMYTTEYQCTGDEFAIEPQRQMIFFRIVQEALNNVIRHAHANHITVCINFKKPMLEISVQDDGKGFVYLPDQGGFVNQSGIANMSKRAKLINALFSIKSELGKGTMVQLSHQEPLA
jgi:two-component system, NarL family, sensor kinase